MKLVALAMFLILGEVFAMTCSAQRAEVINDVEFIGPVESRELEMSEDVPWQAQIQCQTCLDDNDVCDYVCKELSIKCTFSGHLNISTPKVGYGSSIKEACENACGKGNDCSNSRRTVERNAMKVVEKGECN